VLFEDDHQSVPANRSAPQAVGCQGGLMDWPQVIIHNLISLEGRLAGFPADAGLYYELASRLPHQAVLTGSGTMLAAAASEGIDLSEEDPEPLRGMRVTGSAAAGDPRPLLVIVDGQGRVTRYSWLGSSRSGVTCWHCAQPVYPA
jgi:riboflavin biosynthesis pyrimidine reductase